MEQTLEDLIEHRSWVHSSLTLAEVADAFKPHPWEFMAVLQGGEFIGLCSRADLADALGSRYGFALHQARPITDCLRKEALQLLVDTDLNHAFERVFSRDLGYFYDDVVVLDHGGGYRGLIRTHALIRLQHHFHRESISLLTRQTEDIERRNRQMLEDLGLCSELQRALFPRSTPVFSPETHQGSAPKLSHFYHPHGVVGGDFFYWRRWSPHSIGILIADVMGHDLRAALVTTMMRALFEELACEERPPGEVLFEMNQRLVKMVASSAETLVYVTACYLMMDLQRGVVSLSSAGHPMPLMIPAKGGPPSFLLEEGARGTLLGVFEEADYSSVDLAVSSGDRLLLYTDGIYEIQDPSGVLFGHERLLGEVERFRPLDGEGFLQELVRTARAHAVDEAFQDDVCLIVVEA